MIGDILQPTHLLFILVIALLVLGPKRLPEVGRALGRGLRDFRSAVSGDDIREALTAPIESPQPPVAVTAPAERPSAAHEEHPSAETQAMPAHEEPAHHAEPAHEESEPAQQHVG